jgi:signal transduction histidine kinase/ligand-binding sensor domain-containing protein
MLFFCLALPPVVSAELGELAGPDYVVKVWGADEGLTEGSVTDIAQTPEGYLWIGTLFGSVLRFDGMRFVRYNSANTPEFLLKWGIPRLTVDRGGTLWISMHDGGMTTWDQQGFHSMFSSTNQPDHLLWSAPGRVIFVFGDGRLLSGNETGGQWAWQTVTLPDALPQPQCCADADGQIWYLRAENKIGTRSAAGTNGFAPGLAGQAPKILAADAQGHVWLGTDQSLAVWRTNCFAVMTPTNGEAVLNVKRILPTGGGGVWVEANGQLRRCAGRRWVAHSDGWDRELGRRTSLRFLRGDSEGGLWSGADDLGLIHVAPNGNFRRLTTKDGLPSNTVHFVYEDRDGDMWTGYDRGGLVQIRRRQFRTIGANEGLSDTLINTVCEDQHGAVWIGTHSGLVGRYENGVCTNLTLTAPARIQDSCVAADAQGRVWIGAQGVGLLLADGGQWQPVATQNELQGYPRLLLPTRDGQLWVGTLLSIISVSNGTLHFEYTSKTVGGHPTALAEGADGTIWAGTLAGVLLHWDGHRFALLEPPDRNSLGRIWALWPTADGGLWAGTEEGGLLRWSHGRFTRYTMKNGLPSDSIVQILGDADGNLWLGTRAGIARILGTALLEARPDEPGKLQVSVYGPSDGLLTIGSAIVYQPRGWRGPDGKLLFAMANSVAEVDPSQVHVNPRPPALALEEMRSDNKLVWPERAGAIVTIAQADGAHAAHAPALKVGPGRGDLEFSYTGLSLGSPLRLQFKYQLAGLENSWNNAGTERQAIYRHVPPGQYVFRVIACNSDGVYSQPGDLLLVTVRPHFYQSVWFLGGIGLLAVFGLSVTAAVAMRHRMRRRLDAMKRQHEVERERARIAQDLHDDLGAGLTEIGLLSGMLQDPARLASHKHEALNRIAQRCHDLVTGLDEIVWAVNPRNDSVNSLGSYLCRYAQGFLEPAAIRCHLEMQDAKPDRPLNSEQRHNLFLAFKEALANVAKHSAATGVRIKIGCDADDCLTVRIEDNGCGFPPAAGGAPGADGLVNLRHRLAHIGGRCDITSQAAGGVSVCFSLPLAPPPHTASS